jgi:hypothetical protein
MSREAVLSTIDVLDAAAVPYMLVGSFSSNAYGVARSTQGADFVIQLGSTPISAIVSQLGKDFLLNPQMSFETITATTRLELRHVRSGFKIELFLLSEDPHDQERFCRRRKATALGRTIWLPTPEDVIVTKLRWSLAGKRAKDVDDVRNVIAVQAERIDWDYVHRWCDVHGTRELLEQIRRSLR